MRIDEVFMFIYKGSHSEIIIDKSILEKITGSGTMPLLWCRNGEYCIIPVAVVKNAIDVMSMYTISGGKRIQPTPVILWPQGVPISNLAGRALIGE